MADVPEMIPVTDLRQGAADVLARLRKKKKPVVITQRGRAAAVLVSIEAYEETERQNEILRRIAKGDHQVKKGKGFDLDDVMAEAAAIVDP